MSRVKVKIIVDVVVVVVVVGCRSVDELQGARREKKPPSLRALRSRAFPFKIV